MPRQHEQNCAMNRYRTAQGLCQRRFPGGPKIHWVHPGSSDRLPYYRSIGILERSIYNLCKMADACFFQRDGRRSSARAAKQHNFTSSLHNRGQLFINFTNFNVLGINLRTAHVSFPSAPASRLEVFVGDDKEEYGDGKYFVVPRVIIVNSSCIARVSFSPLLLLSITRNKHRESVN